MLRNNFSNDKCVFYFISDEQDDHL